MTSARMPATDTVLAHDAATMRSGSANTPSATVHAASNPTASIPTASTHATTWRAAPLLADLGFGDDFTLTRLSGGANNQVFRVDSSRRPVVLKVYFQHDGDHRDGDRHDRLGAEYAFLSFAWGHGVRNVPRPLACDRQQGLAVYELVPGRRLAPEEVDATAIEQAIDFYQSLNRHKHSARAAALTHAAEACYTIGEHLACVERRLERLLYVEPSAGVAREAVDFVRSDLRAGWVRASRIARRDAARHGLSLEQPIADGDRCLSPSDFGFHNALFQEVLLDEAVSDGALLDAALSDGAASLRFIDFEYAGWDDPAKLVCDFFCQPAVPVPRECFDNVSEAVAADLSTPDVHLRRFRLLLPVYQIKWCCILLNDFLPAGNRRREFALPATQQEERQSRQLQKARTALACVA